METRQRAVRPRDAATLVLVRGQGSETRVLMGQRSAGHVFMPNKFVFPGGRVDPGDSRIHAASELRSHVRTRLERGCTPSRARGLALASVRETFEETGLLVGARLPQPPRTRARSWTAFFAQGVVPHLEPLELIARAITPPGDTRRFDARFFMVDAAHIQGDVHESPTGSGELLDLHWVPVAEAKRLDLPIVTQLVIDEITRRVSVPEAERGALTVPFFNYSWGEASFEQF